MLGACWQTEKPSSVIKSIHHTSGTTSGCWVPSPEVGCLPSRAKTEVQTVPAQKRPCLKVLHLVPHLKKKGSGRTRQAGEMWLWIGHQRTQTDPKKTPSPTEQIPRFLFGIQVSKTMSGEVSTHFGMSHVSLLFHAVPLMCEKINVIFNDDR